MPADNHHVSFFEAGANFHALRRLQSEADGRNLNRPGRLHDVRCHVIPRALHAVQRHAKRIRSLVDAQIHLGIHPGQQRERRIRHIHFSVHRARRNLQFAGKTGDSPCEDAIERRHADINHLP